MLTEKELEVEALIEKEHDIWTCKACEMTGLTREIVRNHAETHISGLQYECEFCGKIFNRRNSWAIHIFRKHKKEKDQIMKKGKTQNNSENVADKGPVLIAKGNENVLAETDKVAPPQRDLISQDINTEIKSKIQKLLKQKSPTSWQCTVCLRTRKLKISLINHVEAHLDYSHPCPECSFSSKTRKDLKLHFREAHL